MKALVGVFNQEKALVGAFSVIVQLHRLIDLRHYCRLQLASHPDSWQLVTALLRDAATTGEHQVWLRDVRCRDDLSNWYKLFSHHRTWELCMKSKPWRKWRSDLLCTFLKFLLQSNTAIVPVTMKSCVLIIIRHVILYGQNMTRLIVLAPVFYPATPEHKLPVCC